MADAGAGDRALAAAVAAVAAEAGALALARAGTPVERRLKPDGSPVSEVDLAVDALLRERLTALVPAAGWLSEESVDDPARLARPLAWIVDPIDGTRDFLRGRDGWCVSVALVEGGVPVLGVLDAPARGQRWLAVAGGGASRDGAPLAAARRTALAGARVPADALPRAERDLFQAVPRPNSIALRLAMVASGAADLVVSARWGGEWDLAAAALVAAEAGAEVTDAAGRPLRFNTPEARVHGVLATAAGLHAAALARLGVAPPA